MRKKNKVKKIYIDILFFWGKVITENRRTTRKRTAVLIDWRKISATAIEPIMLRRRVRFDKLIEIFGCNLSIICIGRVGKAVGVFQIRPSARIFRVRFALDRRWFYWHFEISYFAIVELFLHLNYSRFSEVTCRLSSFPFLTLDPYHLLVIRSNT